jgi:hypothetical protein
MTTSPWKIVALSFLFACLVAWMLRLRKRRRLARAEEEAWAERGREFVRQADKFRGRQFDEVKAELDAVLGGMRGWSSFDFGHREVVWVAGNICILVGVHEERCTYIDERPREHEPWQPPR